MRYFGIIIFVAFICVSASAQVDTLQLVEIGSIQAPSEITELYVEDLDGDSLKEIIICTDYYVYIYDSQTYQVQWTSPPLNHPTDLLFEDINGNGLIDLSAKDGTNIHLFDPHTPQTIWISPVIENTYRDHTIGDGDNDNWIDVVFIDRIQTPPDIFHDTLKISVYWGPDFQATVLLDIPIYDFERDMGESYYSFHEYLRHSKMAHLTGPTGYNNPLLLFIKYREIIDAYDPLVLDFDKISGRLYHIDLSTSQVTLHYNLGELVTFMIEDHNDFRHLYALTNMFFSYGNDYGAYYDNTKSIIEIDADTLLGTSVLWSQAYNDWGGYITGEANSLYPGGEISFISNDSIYLHDFSTAEYIWSLENSENIDTLLFSFNSASLFNSPQIVSKTTDQSTTYKFLNGSDGFLSAILHNAGSGFLYSRTSDLDLDGNDDILIIDYNNIHFYNIDYATGVADNLNPPNRTFLRPNYPNPFNSQTTIEYGLPEAGRVRIDIYDLLGRKVETLVDEDMRAGRHRAVWDASEYSSGVYFYRIEAGDLVDAKRMVYLK